MNDFVLSADKQHREDVRPPRLLVVEPEVDMWNKEGKNNKQRKGGRERERQTDRQTEIHR